MKRQDFIDELQKHGWEAVHDAQHTEIVKLWAKLFPTVAEMENELADAIESAHMAGQYNNGDGVDPSFSNAQQYRREVLGV